jgi:hypothetical protein
VVLPQRHLRDFTAAAGVERLHYAVLLPSAEQCLQRVAEETAQEILRRTRNGMLSYP